jgi:hypothetical protein
MRWRDPRLVFYNLKNETYLNPIGIVDAAKIWQPVVVFYNTKDRDETTVIQASWNLSSLKIVIYPFCRMMPKPAWPWCAKVVTQSVPFTICTITISTVERKMT